MSAIEYSGVRARPRRLGVMQPYFVPYIGYFALIVHCDRFILFDSAQYVRHSWMNRNRILKPGGGWQYIGVPLAKHPREASIAEVVAAEHEDWRQRMRGQLMHYRKRAPHFDLVMDVLEAGWKTGPHLAQINCGLLHAVLAYLGIERELQFLSALSLDLPPVNDPGGWAPAIAGTLKAERYINPSGGKELFDPDAFARAGVELQFLTHQLPSYPQRTGKPFEAGLSIIDVLMFNDAEAVKEMLHAYILE